MRDYKTLVLLLSFSLLCHAQALSQTSVPQPLRLVTYNVENLFDCRHDSLKNDSAFLPEGSYHWTKARLYHKLHNLSQVICNLGGEGSSFRAPALIALQEVENDSSLIMLLRQLPQEHFPYRYIHYESPDRRGVDVALLYDSTRFSSLVSKPISIPYDSLTRPTRDVLYTSMLNDTDTLHCLVCHLPSQIGGAAQTQQRRQQVITLIKHHTDSLLAANPHALIIVMGDFNSSPQQNLSPLVNLMYHHETPIGTHKYQGMWALLDQIYVSPALLNQVSAPQIFSPDWLLDPDPRHLGVQPKRTFVGPRYQGGYSDHLPVFIDWQR